MTEEQKIFATEHHNLIYSFLNKHNLDADEWYGVCAIAFCNACVEYDGSTTISTYAYKCMLNAVRHEMKMQKYQKRDSRIFVLSLNEKAFDDGECEFGDLIPSNDSIDENLIAEDTLNDILKSCITDLQKKYVRRLAVLGRQSDLVRELGCSKNNISVMMLSIKNRYEDKVQRYNPNT